MAIKTSHSEVESVEISATADALDEALSYAAQEVSRRGLNCAYNLTIQIEASHTESVAYKTRVLNDDSPTGYTVGIFAQFIQKSEEKSL